MLAIMAGVTYLRAVVVGGDARVRHAVGGLLVAGGRVHLVGEAETGADVARVVARMCPDLVVIDLDVRDTRSWLGVIAIVRVRCAAVAIVAVAASPTLAVVAVDAGADAFVSKLESAEELCDAVDAAVKRRSSVL